MPFLLKMYIYQSNQSVSPSQTAKSEDSQTQTTATEVAAIELNLAQNTKIIGLIEALNQQRISHLDFNVEHLKEQFQHIGCQFKKVNTEIKKLGKSTEKRHETLSDFRHIVKSFTAICDQENYIKQFNVYFWLFQQMQSKVTGGSNGMPQQDMATLNNQFYEYLDKTKQNELNAYKVQQQRQQATTGNSPQKFQQKIQNQSSLFDHSKSVYQTPQVNGMVYYRKPLL